MATEKTPNYTEAQVALIVSTIRDNGGVADKSVAETLAANPAMNVDGEPRKVRSIIAKMRRVVDDNPDLSYAKVQPTTKDGRPVQKKLDLVARIAAGSGIAASKLNGLEKGPKLALESLAAWADSVARTGTEG